MRLHCWRVENRIACSACDYPQSEALYANLKEWREANPTAMTDEYTMRNYKQYAEGAALFGEPT